MATPVTTRPAPSLLERFRVGQPVSSSQVRRWVQELNFLRAYNVQQIGAHYYRENTLLAAASRDYPVLYNRRDGIRAIRVVANVHPDTDGNQFDLGLYINGAGSTANIGSGLVLPSTRHRIATHHFDTATVSSSGVIVVAARMTATDNTKGLRSLALHEIPRSTVDPLQDATEPGANEASVEARNRMHTPTSPDTADGLRRLLYELDRARSQLRRCAQIATSEDTATDTIQATGTGYAPLNWRAHAGDPTFYIRPRRLYDETVSNSCTFYCRYYWTGGGTAKVRANVTSLTTGTTSSAEITLSTITAWTVQNVALTLPVDGADQICLVTFDADADGTVIDISNLAIFDTET